MITRLAGEGALIIDAGREGMGVTGLALQAVRAAMGAVGVGMTGDAAVPPPDRRQPWRRNDNPAGTRRCIVR